jgi:YaiO family outer membrane protein
MQAGGAAVAQDGPLTAPAAEAGIAAQQEGKADWQAEVRQRITAKDLNGALSVAEIEIRNSPRNLEARGWRARILSWTGRWAEAEADFRMVLAVYPEDSEMLVGLANVLSWQQRFEEALELLDRAKQLQPGSAEVHNSRGRLFRSMGRTQDARTAFQEALASDPGNADAQRGLDSVREQPRHLLLLGSDFDVFNFTTQDARGYFLNLRSDLSDRWTSVLETRFDRRFGEQAGRFSGSITYRFGRRDAFTFGGAAARDQGIIPKGEAFFEYNHGFSFSRTDFIRGVDFSLQHRWLWFESARVQTTSPGLLFYLPRNWQWSLRITAARSRFPGTVAEWRPSGITRLAFPLYRRLSGNVFFGVGTENFAEADQLGRFSARTFGGGARIELGRLQEISFYLAHQHRSQNRTQLSIGVTYGVRF